MQKNHIPAYRIYCPAVDTVFVKNENAPEKILDGRGKMTYNISQFEKRKGLGMTGKQRKRHPENVFAWGLSVQFSCTCIEAVI
jgi:hypothetical protein